MTRKGSGKSKENGPGANFGGLLGGLTELIEKLAELAQTGKEL